MEQSNLIQPELPSTTADTPVPTQPAQEIKESKVAEPKRKTATILGMLVLTLLIAGVYYLFVMQAAIQAPTEVPNATLPPNEEPVETIGSETNQISAEWTLQTTDLCGVTIPIPPKQEPYYSFSYPEDGAATDNGRFWQFEDQAESTLYLFKKSAMAVFSFESGPSNGYTPGLISVHCADNTSGYTNETLLAAMRDNFQENYPESGIKIASVVNNRWGREVLDVRLSYAESDAVDTATIFATPQYIYYVYLKSDSSNPGVVDTANKIFEDLQF